MTQHAIAGVLPVVHMPYTESGEIDLNTMEKQIDYLFATGADGFCLALVSDLFRLSEEERVTLPAQLCKFARQRGPVVINVAAESTRQARLYARSSSPALSAFQRAVVPSKSSTPGMVPAIPRRKESISNTPPLPSKMAACPCVAARSAEIHGPSGEASGLNNTR